MYIKINLLPLEFRPGKTLIAFDYRVVLIILIVLAAAGLAGYYVYINRTLAGKKTELENLQNQQAMIMDTVGLKNEVKVLKEKIKERVDIIKDLTSDSDIRFDMLKHINSIVPENLWLLNISEDVISGRIVFTIEGMSYLKKDISRFLEGLVNYKKFKSVALESIAPSPLETQDAFQFIVKVELLTNSPTAEAKPPEKK